MKEFFSCVSMLEMVTGPTLTISGMLLFTFGLAENILKSNITTFKEYIYLLASVIQKPGEYQLITGGVVFGIIGIIITLDVILAIIKIYTIQADTPLLLHNESTKNTTFRRG